MEKRNNDWRYFKINEHKSKNGNECLSWKYR